VVGLAAGTVELDEEARFRADVHVHFDAAAWVGALVGPERVQTRLLPQEKKKGAQDGDEGRGEDDDGGAVADARGPKHGASALRGAELHDGRREQEEGAARIPHGAELECGHEQRPEDGQAGAGEHRGVQPVVQAEGVVAVDLLVDRVQPPAAVDAQGDDLEENLAPADPASAQEDDPHMRDQMAVAYHGWDGIA